MARGDSFMQIYQHTFKRLLEAYMNKVNALYDWIFRVKKKDENTDNNNDSGANEEVSNVVHPPQSTGKVCGICEDDIKEGERYTKQHGLTAHKSCFKKAHKMAKAGGMV